VFGDALVDVRLVDDLRDQLRPLADGVGVGCGQLGARDLVLGAIDEQQGEEGPDAVDEQGDNEDIRYQEYEHAFPHGEIWVLSGGCVRSKGAVLKRERLRQRAGKQERWKR